jgi:hypothetical protein
MRTAYLSLLWWRVICFCSDPCVGKVCRPTGQGRGSGTQLTFHYYDEEWYASVVTPVWGRPAGNLDRGEGGAGRGRDTALYGCTSSCSCWKTIASLSHGFDKYFLHCFIWRPTDSNVTEDAGIKLCDFCDAITTHPHTPRSHPQG